MTKTYTPTTLPENALRLFDLYVADAGNWSGSPLVNSNVTLLGEREDRGLLSHLKRAGVITTRQDSENRKCYWLHFTADGNQLALDRGLALDGIEEVLESRTHWVHSTQCPQGRMEVNLTFGGYEVGKRVKVSVAAPGTGYYTYVVTRVDERAAYGLLVASTVRELTAEEVW